MSFAPSSCHPEHREGSVYIHVYVFRFFTSFRMTRRGKNDNQYRLSILITKSKHAFPVPSTSDRFR